MFRDRLTFAFPEYGVDVSMVEDVVQDLVRKRGESINLRKKHVRICIERTAEPSRLTAELHISSCNILESFSARSRVSERSEGHQKMRLVSGLMSTKPTSRYDLLDRPVLFIVLLSLSLRVATSLLLFVTHSLLPSFGASAARLSSPLDPIFQPFVRWDTV